MEKLLKTEIEVYLDGKVREHASAIISTGYRHTSEKGGLEWYPPHRVVKVLCVDAGAESRYTGRVRAT